VKVGITGHTKGIGKAIADLYPDHLGFSRSNGFDISNKEIVDLIVSQINDCDIFVNNAYHQTSQTILFKKIFNLWRDNPYKTIVNINSIAKYGLGNTKEEIEYSKNKKLLYTEASRVMFSDKKCRIVNINPGYVRTDMVKSISSNVKMLNPIQVANIIKYTLDLPQEIEIGEISVWVNSL